MDVELDFEKRYRLVREIIETVVLTVLMFLIIRLAVQNFNIEGRSMEPSLHDQELVLVDKWSYFFRTPARGDVIVFQAPPEPDKDYIKRIVAVPGDIITVRGINVFVNGKQLQEVYISPENQGNFYAPVENRLVPPDTYFVMGDNRIGSSDSRHWGCVPRSNIVGKAALVYWPIGTDNWGLIPNVTEFFASIPQTAPTSITPTGVCQIGMSLDPIQTRAPTAMGSFAGGYDINTLLMLVLPGLYVGIGGRRRE